MCKAEATNVLWDAVNIHFESITGMNEETSFKFNLKSSNRSEMRQQIENKQILVLNF